MTADLILAHDSPLPLYHQIKEILRKRVNRGDFQPDELIPTEKELELQYKVSRTTIRKALQDLVTSGILYRKQGVGTFVAIPKIRHNSQDLMSFSEEMKARGFQPGAQLISFSREAPGDHVMKKLSLNQGENVYEIRRLRLADGNPVGIHTSYLSTQLIKDLSENMLLKYGSLYQLLEENYNTSITHADESLEAILVNDEEAAILQIDPNSPLLLVARVAYYQKNTPIEFVKMVYRPDLYKYFSRLSREPKTARDN